MPRWCNGSHVALKMLCPYGRESSSLSLGTITSMFKRYKPRKVQIFTWSAELAYAVGLIVTDGCLSSNGKSVAFTSKDLEQIENFKKILKLTSKTGYTKNPRSTAYRIYFSSVQFFDWLVSIGLSTNKSLILGPISIPDNYFKDFLRGHLDGDGSITTYIDSYNTKIKASYVYKRLLVRFISGSSQHIRWLYDKIYENLGAKGALHITPTSLTRKNPIYTIKFAKKESLKLLKQIYYSPELPCLSRKKGIYLDFITNQLN